MSQQQLMNQIPILNVYQKHVPIVILIAVKHYEAVTLFSEVQGSM